MRIIHAKLHGLLDYITVLFVLLSPMLFGMEGSLCMMTYTLGIFQLALSLMTSYPAGLVKKIPFLLHGYIEFAVALYLAIAAIYYRHIHLQAGFEFYASLAIVYLVVFILTDFSFGKR